MKVANVNRFSLDVYKRQDMLEICIGVTVISAILALAHIAARFLPDSLMDRLMKILR